MSRTIVCGAVVVFCLTAVGCSGDDPVTSTPPASVQGYWATTSVNNAGSATLTGCTGDLVDLEGITIEGLGGGADCSISEWPYTSQNGGNYTHHSVQFACVDGNYGTQGGGGTISGNNLQGQIDTNSQYWGHIASDHYSGGKSGSSTLNLSESRITFTGSISGSCNVNPPLSITMEVLASPPAAMTLGGSVGSFSAADRAASHLLARR